MEWINVDVTRLLFGQIDKTKRLNFGQAYGSTDLLPALTRSYTSFVPHLPLLSKLIVLQRSPA